MVTTLVANELVELRARINNEAAKSGHYRMNPFYSSFLPMKYLAIDVSKDELVCYLHPSGEHYSIANTAEDVRQFLKDHPFDPSDIIIGCESTGDYHLVAAKVCLEMGYQFKILNPLLTKQVINATVRKKKTDRTDAEIIAQLLERGEGENIALEGLQQEKRTMLRTQQRLIECSAMLKRVQKTLQEKAKVMDTSEAMAAVERCIEVLREEGDELTKKATEEQDRQEEIIDSVPGCGVKLAAIISAEAGNIKRFPSARQFKAYVGIDPKVSQSGNSSHTGRMTKRGNPLLRQALYLAAHVAWRYDPELRDFYEKKRAEGKSYRHTVCTVARKLCERIYAIVTKDCLYTVNTTPLPT